MFGEKSYRKSGYQQYDCPRCQGSGLDTMAIFTQVECKKCHGDGFIMVENSRDSESARHEQSDNNEHKNRWLFS